MTADSVALATALSELDPSRGTIVSRIADGWAVLWGPGMFVNRLEGAGIDVPLHADHIDQFEAAARLVGVTPAVALPESAEAHNDALLRASGYQPGSAVTVAAMSLDEVASNEAVTEFTVERVATSESLQHWQRAAAIGWEHQSATGRGASDAFAEAAAQAPGSSLLLVRDASTGDIVATCALTVRDGLATLGGMSVLPTERRRGVQAAAIGLRLAEARRQGCDLAVTSTVVGGDSERNVARHGFLPSHRVTTWIKPDQPGGSEKTGLSIHSVGYGVATQRKELTMSGEFDKVKGRVKQAAGDLTDDDKLRNKGKVDEAAGKMKDGVDKVKDKVDDAVDAVKRNV